MFIESFGAGGLPRVLLVAVLRVFPGGRLAVGGKSKTPVAAIGRLTKLCAASRGLSVALMLRYEKEQTATMKRFRMIGVALLAVFALGAVAASASAETAPYFTVGGTRLVKGATHNIAARVYNGNSFTLTGGGLKITCTTLKTSGGVLLGSNAGEPGKDNEIVEFSGCSLVEGNGAPGCELEGTTITTNALISEQVESVVNSKNGGQLLEVFRAAGTNGFVTLHFTPESKCTLTEAVVSGSTVAEILKDETAEGKIELGQAPTQATSYLVKFPATPIKQVWLISNGTGKIAKTGQTVFGNESVQTGTSLVLLASTKFVAEYVSWSGLP